VKVALEKPATPDELAHFGTKGMKWGVRKTAGTHEFHAKYPTAESRASAIRQSRVNVNKAYMKFANEKNPDKREELRKAWVNHPDRPTALRLTRGEKFAASAVAGLAPTVVAPAAVAGIVGARVGQRRALEK
jgi:hypothetical protein